MACTATATLTLAKEWHKSNLDSGLIKLTCDLLNLVVNLKNLLHREEGQDLIEYALVVALIALAATAGMTSVATSINTAFSNIGAALTIYTG